MNITFPYFFSSVIGSLALVGVIISIVAFFDCIRRDKEQFGSIFTSEGKYEKFLWIIVIILSAKLFGIGAIAYYVFLRRLKVQSVR